MTSHPATRALDLLLPHHADAFQALAADPEILATTRLPDPFLPGTAARYIAKRTEDREQGLAYWFAITENRDLVGACGVFGLTTDRPEIGYWVGRAHWRRGYATFGLKMLLEFAFRNLRLERVGAYVHESNAASRRVALRAGFRLLGVAAEAEPPPGRAPGPLVDYELTRTEWDAALTAPVLAVLHPALTAILAAELAAGNEIAETGRGWPDADSVSVRLRHPFRTQPSPLPADVVYTEPNDPRWWKADYSTRSPRHLLIS